MIQVETNIWIFGTNVATETDKKKILDSLRANPQIQDCSLDSEDVDKVLRVVSASMGQDEIIGILNTNGFTCKELE